MLIQYQNTFEEYVEASEALAARKAKKRRANAGVSTAVIVIFFVVAIWFYQTIGRANQFTVLFHLLSPIAFSFAIVAVVLCIMSLMAGRLPRGAVRAAIRLGFFFVMLIPAFVLYRFLHVINPLAPRFVWRWTMLLPHTTWMFFVAWLSVLTIKSQQNTRKRLWNAQLSLHRAKTADISAGGIVVTDTVSRNETHWDGFVGWKETKTLFVLFPSEVNVLFLPKSAFASDEELEAMRSLARFIPSTAAAAFAVIQSDATLSNPPPLPAQKNLSV
jgi:YcxB-like protein